MSEGINGPLLHPPIITTSASADRFELSRDLDDERDEHPILLTIGALKVWLSVTDALVLGHSLIVFAEKVADLEVSA